MDDPTERSRADRGPWTVPNLISFVRLAAVPVFLWLLLVRDDVVGAAWLLAAIGASDWLDGYLARILDQRSALGEVLDPTADRVAVAAALVGGWVAGVVPGWLAAALLFRELVVVVAAGWLALRGVPRIPVRFLGKTATLLLYVAVPAFYLEAATGVEPLRLLAWSTGLAGTVLYYAVLVQYGADLRRATAAG